MRAFSGGSAHARLRHRRSSDRRRAIAQGFLARGGGRGDGADAGRHGLGTVRTAARLRPPARAVILLWLWGGPSHLDTFDMKPDAPAEYRGPFEPIATAVPGLHVCELLPGLAARAERFALLRAMHHESNDHGVAGTIALTGSIAGAVGLGGAAEHARRLRPSTGAIVGRLHRREAGVLPPYVILGNPLHQGLKRAVGEGGGSLGSTHDPFRLDYEPGVGLKLPEVGTPRGRRRRAVRRRAGDCSRHLDRASRAGPTVRRPAPAR